jgi:hypothetical protein
MRFPPKGDIYEGKSVAGPTSLSTSLSCPWWTECWIPNCFEPIDIGQLIRSRRPTLGCRFDPSQQ